MSINTFSLWENTDRIVKSILVSSRAWKQTIIFIFVAENILLAEINTKRNDMNRPPNYDQLIIMHIIVDRFF